MMRKMWGVSWAAVKDEGFYEEWIQVVTTEVEDAVARMGRRARWEEDVAARKFSWAGHMVRRGDSRRSARVLRMEETTSRAKRGRPKQRWEDTMRGLMGNGWQDAAADREWWRYFGDEVPNWIRGRLD